MLCACCSSGTAAAEFGAEASRTVWRVALDALWHGAPEATAFCNTISASLIGKLIAINASRSVRRAAAADGGPGGALSGGLGGGSGGGDWQPIERALLSDHGVELDVPPSCRGRVEAVHSGWSSVGFMLGPLSAALAVPLPPEHALAGHPQQAALDIAAARLAEMPVESYYPGSWVTIATLTLEGALPAVGPLLATLTSVANRQSDAQSAEQLRAYLKVLCAPAVLLLCYCVCKRTSHGGLRGGASVSAASARLRPVHTQSRRADSEERLPLSSCSWTSPPASEEE